MTCHRFGLRSWIAFLALSLAVAPVARAEQVSRALGGGQQQNPPAQREARASENLISLVGAAPDGSAEEKYSVAFQEEFGGQRLHGTYSISDLVNAIARPGRERKPLENLYFMGHIVMVPAKNMPDVKPVKPGEPYVGFVIVGKQHRAHALNFQGQFIKELDAAYERTGLTPDKVWARKSLIAFRVCLVAYYMPEFLEELAERVPSGTSIEAYSVPFVWSTATWYPLFSNVFGPVNQKYLFGEQAQGLTTIQGRWKPQPLASRRPARPERAPGFEGLEAGE